MAAMAITADIVVIGLGAVGSAALYSRQAGRRVIGIDRFDPPHDQGSSHGETRITRQAIGEGREFVPLVLRSNEIWEELEAATGRSLMTRNGGLVLATSRSAAAITVRVVPARHDRRRPGFGIPHQVVDRRRIRRRYPQFRLTQRARIFRARRRFSSPRGLCGNTARPSTEIRRQSIHIRNSGGSANWRHG